MIPVGAPVTITQKHTETHRSTQRHTENMDNSGITIRIKRKSVTEAAKPSMPPPKCWKKNPLSKVVPQSPDEVHQWMPLSAVGGVAAVVVADGIPMQYVWTTPKVIREWREANRRNPPRLLCADGKKITLPGYKEEEYVWNGVAY